MPNLQKIISAGYLLEPGCEREIEKLSEQQINFLANLKAKPLMLTRKILEAVANGKAQTILLDEVIGARGFFSNKTLEAKEIFWPDIPLKETKKVESPAIVLIAPTAEILQKNFSQNFNYTICFEPAQIPISKKIGRASC